MSEMIITKDNFNTEVMESDKPVLLDFWAEWCSPCRMMAPVVAEAAEKYEGRVKVGKVNVDEEPELARKFRVMSIPTLLVIENGRETDRSVGYAPLELVDELLGLK